MSPTEQKQMMLVMHRFQNGTVFTVGPLSEINFELAAEVLI